MQKKHVWRDHGPHFHCLCQIEVVKQFPFISFGGQKGYEEAESSCAAFATIDYAQLTSSDIIYSAGLPLRACYEWVNLGIRHVSQQSHITHVTQNCSQIVGDRWHLSSIYWWKSSGYFQINLDCTILLYDWYWFWRNLQFLAVQAGTDKYDEVHPGKCVRQATVQRHFAWASSLFQVWSLPCR